MKRRTRVPKSEDTPEIAEKKKEKKGGYGYGVEKYPRCLMIHGRAYTRHGRHLVALAGKLVAHSTTLFRSLNCELCYQKKYKKKQKTKELK